MVPELLRPKPVGLPFDRNGTEAAEARRTCAVFAAEIGAIRGDLWAEAAFAGARFMGTDRSTSLDRTNSGQLARARANADTAVALAAANGAAWFFWRDFRQVRRMARTALGRFSKCRISPRRLPGPRPWRLERGATSSALADKDLQAFIKSDIRGILDRGPEFQQAIMAADRNAWRQNQPILESLVADADPAVAQLLRSGQPK